MWLEVDRLLSLFGRQGIVDARPQHHGPSEGAEPAGNMNGARPSKVVNPEFIKPAAGVPFPVSEASVDVCQRATPCGGCSPFHLHVVHECRPAQKEEHTRPKPASL